MTKLSLLITQAIIQTQMQIEKRMPNSTQLFCWLCLYVHLRSLLVILSDAMLKNVEINLQEKKDMKWKNIMINQTYTI